MTESSRPEFPTRPCPICLATSRQRLYEQAFAQFSEGSLLGGYDVVACTVCGMAFADQIPGQEVFDTYYRDMSKYEGATHCGRPSEYDLARFRLLATFAEPFLSSRHVRILEFGCATAGLLAELKSRGYENGTGVDPSPVCAAQAMQLYGIRVLPDTLHGMRVDDGSMDFLFLVGVLEHVRELESALGRLHSMLSSNGRICVAVPDASRYADGEDAPFQEFSVEHINFFGPTSLQNLMQRNGFVPIAVQQTMIEANHRTLTPALYGVYQKTESRSVAQIAPDAATTAGLVRYIEKSRRQDETIRKTVDRLVDRDTPIIVWGAGAHTLRLMITSRLAEARVSAFVDSNPRYWGKELNTVPIIAPEALKGRSEPVLVSSRVFQEEIKRQVREDLGLDNEIITLYDISPQGRSSSKCAVRKARRHP